MACDKNGVLYDIELVKGKDDPPEILLKDHSKPGNTVGLLLCLTLSLWGNSKLVIIYSGFSVLKGIVELGKNDVFASVSIKKQIYWSRYTKGDTIKKKIEEESVKYVDAWRYVLEVNLHVNSLE